MRNKRGRRDDLPWGMINKNLNLNMKKQQEQLTLDDNSDTEEEEEYQPTEQEIIDYAKFLGMVLPEDHDLLYIAEEGVS